MFTKFKYIVLACFLGFYAASMAHPLHLTITNIDIVSNSINVAIRIFTDDYNLLVLSTLDSISDASMKEPEKEIEKITDYIGLHFGLIASNKKIQLNYLYTEKDDLSVWIYFEGHIQNNLTNLLVENKLFVDMYTDQKNMVIVSEKENQTGLEFTPDETKKTITLRRNLIPIDD